VVLRPPESTLPGGDPLPTRDQRWSREIESRRDDLWALFSSRQRSSESGGWHPQSRLRQYGLHTARMPYRILGHGPSPLVGSEPLASSVERPITPKEMAQLLDLREDWGKILAIPTLEWDGGCSPPLRIIVEFVVVATAWLTGTNQTGTLLGAAEKEAELEVLEIDWSRTRAPWLGEAGSPIPGTALERMIYFGWVLDATNTHAVTVATRADDAEVDLSLWDVGGDGEGMELARGRFRTFLHSFWRRRLTREACSWLRLHDTERGTER
jgi:hypothetical protein